MKTGLASARLPSRPAFFVVMMLISKLFSCLILIRSRWLAISLAATLDDVEERLASYGLYVTYTIHLLESDMQDKVGIDACCADQLCMLCGSNLVVIILPQHYRPSQVVNQTKIWTVGGRPLRPSEKLGENNRNVRNRTCIRVDGGQYYENGLDGDGWVIFHTDSKTEAGSRNNHW